ncbi:hypothetical protein D3C83_118540 [compost metagenome]
MPARRKYRSRRNVPAATICSMGRFVAAMKRTSIVRGVTLPSRRIVRSSMAFKSLA